METNPKYPWRRAATLLLVPVVLTAAGCSAGTSTESGQAAGQAAPADAARSLPEAKPADGAPMQTDRKIARTASLTIVVRDLTSSATALRQIAGAVGGQVISENLVTGAIEGDEARTTPTMYSTIVLSVPAERLDQTLDSASQVGEVRVRTVSAEDVTTQVVDVEARVKTMRESISRIRALMERAGTLTEIANLEAELTRRQSDLEALLAQQKVLSGMVEDATISISLITRKEAEVASDGFLGGLTAGWEALLVAGRVVLTAVGAVLPFAVLGALVGLPAWWWFRRRTRRSAAVPEATAGERPAAGPPDPGSESS